MLLEFLYTPCICVLIPVYDVSACKYVEYRDFDKRF